MGCTNTTCQCRGTGNALPYSCYKNDAERIAAGVTTQMLSGNASDVMPGRLWGLADLLVESCEANNKDTGSLIGTAFVARDMMRIVDALREDGLLRYWGKDKRVTIAESETKCELQGSRTVPRSVQRLPRCSQTGWTG